MLDIGHRIYNALRVRNAYIYTNLCVHSARAAQTSFGIIYFVGQAVRIYVDDTGVGDIGDDDGVVWRREL